MIEDVLAFGKKHMQIGLAETVLDLYDAALKESSKRSYGTGQRAFIAFVNSWLLPSAPLFPFVRQRLTLTELYLAFFMATLVLKPSISVASSILCYESYCKYLFRSKGCHPSAYDTAFLGQLRKGIRNTLPSLPDRRSAFILPRYINDPMFTHATSRKEILTRFLVIIGFVGMPRPHT